MKKWIALALAVALTICLTACSKANYSKISENGFSERGQEYGYFHYPKADWGVNFDELKKQLGKNKSDFTYKAQGEGGNETYTAMLSFLGRECETTFHFAATVEAKQSYLSSVTVKLPTNGKDLRSVKEELVGYIKPITTDITQKAEAATATREENGTNKTVKYDTVSIYTNKTAKDVPQSFQDSYNKIIKQLYDKNIAQFRVGEKNNKSDYENADIYTNTFCSGTGAATALSAIQISDFAETEADTGKYFYITFTSAISAPIGYINEYGA